MASGGSPSNQCAFRRDCTLEAMRTQVARKNSTGTRLKIEDRGSRIASNITVRSFIFDPRSSIFCPYCLVILTSSTPAWTRGLRRWRPPPRSGFGSSVRRTDFRFTVAVVKAASSSSVPARSFLEYRGYGAADHDTHAEEVGGRGVSPVGQVIGEGQREVGSSS